MKFAWQILSLSVSIMLFSGGFTASGSSEAQYVSSLHLCSDYTDVCVLTPHAYAATMWGLEILDISDATTPIKIGEIPTPGEAMGVCVHHGYAYIAHGYAEPAVFYFAFGCSCCV